jgi:hypothetical protein
MATTYTLISSVTVGSGGAANITFSSIPATYTDLSLLVSGRSVRTGANTDDMTLYFNGVSTWTNHSWRLLWGTGSAAQSLNGSGSMLIGAYLTTTGGATTSDFASLSIYIPNYAGSNYKSFSADTVSEQNGTLAYATLTAGLWSDTSAITSITVKPNSANFGQYSTAYLYGISNA